MRKRVDINTEINQMLKLSHKDFIVIVIKMLQISIINSLETNVENRKCKQINSCKKY